jgi:hypothetical protein
MGYMFIYNIFMGSKLLFVIFLIICVSNVYSQITTDNLASEFVSTFSYSLSFSEDQSLFSSLSMGLDLWLILYIENPILDLLLGLTAISINYQYSFIENYNYLIFGYLIFVMGIETSFPMPLIGINGAYNFDKNVFLVIPEIGIHRRFFELAYRYNIIIDNDYYNKHEFLIKFRFPLSLLTFSLR